MKIAKRKQKSVRAIGRAAKPLLFLDEFHLEAPAADLRAFAAAPRSSSLIATQALIKRNSGATVSSGSSMLFEAEDLESNDAVMLKFIKEEPEFERERAILQLLNSHSGAFKHVSFLASHIRPSSFFYFHLRLIRPSSRLYTWY